MLAIVTSKGQSTLPKGIRDALGLKAGSRRDFSINKRSWLLARPVRSCAFRSCPNRDKPSQPFGRQLPTMKSETRFPFPTEVTE
jgi:AbrB family looped-hinge helix DNA binding protein